MSAIAIYFGDALKASEVSNKVMFMDTNTTEGSIHKFLDNMVRGVYDGHINDITWCVHSVRHSGGRARNTYFVFKHAMDVDGSTSGGSATPSAPAVPSVPAVPDASAARSAPTPSGIVVVPPAEDPSACASAAQSRSLNAMVELLSFGTLKYDHVYTGAAIAKEVKKQDASTTMSTTYRALELAAVGRYFRDVLPRVFRTKKANSRDRSLLYCFARVDK